MSDILKKSLVFITVPIVIILITLAVFKSSANGTAKVSVADGHFSAVPSMGWCATDDYFASWLVGTNEIIKGECSQFSIIEPAAKASIKLESHSTKAKNICGKAPILSSPFKPAPGGAVFYCELADKEMPSGFAVTVVYPIDNDSSVTISVDRNLFSSERDALLEMLQSARFQD